MNNVGEKYLPIGTVVMLKGGTKRVMITGFCSMAAEDEGVMYDYSGCMYPEGFLSSDQTALFNHDQIDKVYHVGLVDDEEKQFKSTLNTLVAQMNGGQAQVQPAPVAPVEAPAVPTPAPTPVAPVAPTPVAEAPVPPVGPGLPGYVEPTPAAPVAPVAPTPVPAPTPVEVPAAQPAPTPVEVPAAQPAKAPAAEAPAQPAPLTNIQFDENGVVISA